jgi:hypothetical protein
MWLYIGLGSDFPAPQYVYEHRNSRHHYEKSFEQELSSNKSDEKDAIAKLSYALPYSIFQVHVE